MKTISFEEYLSTKTELEMNVVLSHNHYKLGVTVGRITQLSIPYFNQGCYVIQEGDDRIYMMDQNGNIGQKTIFKLPYKQS